MKKINYDAPNDSVACLSLLRVCRGEGIDTDRVTELLWSINAEGSLTGFLRIIDNLKNVIGEARAQGVSSLTEIDRLSPWLPQIDEILNHASLFINECGEQLIATQKGKNRRVHPLRKICLQRNAIYALLWNRADKTALRSRLMLEGLEQEEIEENVTRFIIKFRILQWHMFYSHLMLMKKYVDINDYLSYSEDRPILGFHNDSLYSSCRSARDYSDAMKWEKFDKLDVLSKSDIFFAKQSNALAEELDVTARSLKTFGTKWLTNTARLREGSHGNRRSRRRRKSTAYMVEYGDNMIISVPNPGDDEAENRSARVLTQWDDSKLWKEADLPEEEAGSDIEEEVLVTHACTVRKDKRDQIMSAIGFAHKRAVHNQHLPIRYEMMTISEVAAAMRTLGDTVKDKTRNLVYRKAAALGILMYWTGSDIQRIRQLVVVPPGADVADDVELAYFMEDNIWRIRVPIYKNKRELPDGVESLCRPWGEHLHSPDLWNAHTFIKIVGEGDDSFKDGHIYKPFARHNLATYSKALNTIFESQRSLMGMRISPARLGNDLFLRLISSSDPVNALLITGKWHSSVSTARHYSTPSVKHLSTLYREIAVGMVEKIRKEEYADRPDLVSLPELPMKIISRSNLGVGAAYCPSVAEVERLIKQVINTMQNERSPLEYNNLYSIYTTLIIGYCTGYRAVNNICLAPSRRDPISQWMWISDKGDARGHHTRRIYLAPVLEQQLKAYEAHRRIVLASWESQYQNVLKPSETALPYLFIVNDSRRKVLPVSSSTMEKPLAELDYPLPLNANRKFLRTELSERGCPSDVLSAFMGHWSLGQEPHGPYSCLSPRHERVKLQKYLLPLLDEIGVQCVASRWVIH